MPVEYIVVCIFACSVASGAGWNSVHGGFAYESPLSFIYGTFVVINFRSGLTTVYACDRLLFPMFCFDIPPYECSLGIVSVGDARSDAGVYG